MIATWLVYTLLVSAGMAVAARGLAGLLAPVGLPTRWAWVAGLAATLALAASAPYRVAPEVRLRVTRVTESVAAGEAAAAPLLDRLAGTLRTALREATGAPLRRLAGATAGWSGSERALRGAWATMSGALLLAFAGTALRHRSIRRRSPVARLLGTEVRVAGDLGPVVTGILRPEIVVPRWLLASPPEEQSLVLAHEEEHRRAGDPLLLAGACAVLVLLPWNPAVWWMASRLRLATELDCDARVLRRGARPLAYGTLLIDIAGRCSGFQPGVSAIAGSRSHLERRLRAMIPGTRRFGLLRGGALGALAVVATLAACEASMPTASDVASMDVSRAEQGAKRIALLPDDEHARYFINGKAATPEEAHALSSERIEAIKMMHRDQRVAGGSADESQEVHEVRILTRDAPEDVRVAFAGDASESGAGVTTIDTLALNVDGAGRRVRVEMRKVAPGEKEPGPGDHMKLRSDGGPAPLLFVDGVRSDPSAMSKLAPDRIAQVEVLKGEAATKLYGSEAAGGVIRITTKKQ
jgi:TonB-dependent SusC/RagA subfamily outer membrane receptor